MKIEGLEEPEEITSLPSEYAVDLFKSLERGGVRTKLVESGEYVSVFVEKEDMDKNINLSPRLLAKILSY